MIINNLNIMSMLTVPYKTNPILVIDPDGMLPVSVTLQLFQMIARREAQIVKNCCGSQHF